MPDLHVDDRLMAATPRGAAVDEAAATAARIGALPLRTHRFGTSGVRSVAPRRLTAIPLTQLSPAIQHLATSVDSGVHFRTPGWYEVLLTVEWDTRDAEGTRFSHTRIPGQEPLHSEAISAAVLHQISDGRQLLRGNAVFGPGEADEVILEVWHDSGQATTVGYAELLIRELQVPWRAGG